LGAEIQGVDLSQPISDALAQELRGALREHLVIFLRDQPLSPAQFLAFAEAMGQPIEYPFVKGLPGFPCVIEVKKTRAREKQLWRHLAFRHHLSTRAPHGLHAAGA